jgi:hypothetical protein
MEIGVQEFSPACLHRLNHLHFDGQEPNYSVTDSRQECKAHNIEFTSSGLFHVDHRGHVQEKTRALLFTRAVERLLL